MISSVLEVAIRTFAPNIIKRIRKVLIAAILNPSSVSTTGPAENSIFPCWFSALLIKVNVRNMLIGIQPDLTALKGTFRRNRQRIKKITAYAFRLLKAETRTTKKT